jgi:hypothetical protein
MKLLQYVISSILLIVPAQAAPLWYNGDWNNSTGLANGRNYMFQDAWIYEDFIVPSGGWTITGVFSNDFFFPGTLPNSVFWEIRSGVAPGSGGVLIGNGTVSATVTPTGRTLFGQSEYTVLGSGLAVPLGPGKYWLAAVPVGSGSGNNPFVSGTLGSNCVGLPCGNDGSAFYYEPGNPSFQFYPTTNFSPDQKDYSFGVIGTAVPEPGSLIPFTLACVLCVFFGRGITADTEATTRRPL